VKTLQLIVFPGGFNWPVWVAQDRGLFAAQGLRVESTPTPNSEFQLTGLIEGRYYIALTAIDNLVAYREGQGASPVLGEDLFAFMGGDRGFLRLVARPEISDIAMLRGHELSVDALTTGYAFALLEILSRNGLELDRDYTTVRAGGGRERFEALVEGKHAATLLISPFDLMAQARDCRVLADVSAALGRYQGLVGGARHGWAEANGDALTGYIRAHVAAVEWLRDPANREEALAIYLAHSPGATRQAAEMSARVLLDPHTGFQARAEIDPEGVETVLAMRSRYGRPQKTLSGAWKYVDLTWYRAALT